MRAASEIRAIRGRLFWFADDPATAGDGAMRYVEDGALAIEGGIIRAAGAARDVLAALPGTVAVADHRPHLVLPGLIDPHLHLPQTQVIASPAEDLLDWLNRYTFVEEQRYGDPVVAAAGARFLIDELLRNGTTTAGVYCSVHAGSAEAFFAESERRGTRMAAGKVMMDRNAPEALRDTAESGYRESKALAERWHGRGRQVYAITPRFALTSTEAQLEAAGALAREFPGCLVQTHLAESAGEIALVGELFPWARDYTDIYDRYGLLRPGALFGHCIHLSERERRRLSDTGSAPVFCPTSNLFLGSGLFDLAAMGAHHRPVTVALATDIGGGTSYSMLRTAAAAYQVLALRGQRMTAAEAFYLMTLGNARAMRMDAWAGTLEPSSEADLVVLDSRATPAMARRMERAQTLEEELFVLMMLGDERAVRATYVMGADTALRGS
jgi:guanine deaminase